MQFSSRISAFRRELNSHDAAEPQEAACPQKRAAQARTSEEPSNLIGPEHGPGQRGSQQESNYLEPQCHIEPTHCVGSSGFQSVRRAAVASSEASGFGPVRRLGNTSRQGRQFSAASGRACRRGPRGKQGPGRPIAGARGAQRCLTLRSKGAPTAGQQARSVHFVYSPQPGPAVLPSSPP